MKMSIINGMEEYNLNLKPVTQICGTDYRKKDYIVNSISKHFSSYKYLPFEERMQDNINIDGKKVGREFFDVIRIDSRDDLLEKIIVSKNSIMNEYITYLLNSYDSQNEFEQLKDCVDRLIISINGQMEGDIHGIEIDYEINDLSKILSKTTIVSEIGESSEELSNIELTKIFLDLVSGIQRYNPVKKLIIFNNIDLLITDEEYKEIINRVVKETKKSDLWVMFFVGTDNYLFMNEEFFEGINIVNDEIFSMPEYDKVTDFILSEYPRNINRNEAKATLEMLPLIVHKVGNDKCCFDIKSLVILKMFNDSIGVKSINKSDNNRIENEYLFFGDM